VTPQVADILVGGNNVKLRIEIDEWFDHEFSKWRLYCEDTSSSTGPKSGGHFNLEPGREFAADFHNLSEDSAGAGRSFPGEKVEKSSETFGTIAGRGQEGRFFQHEESILSRRTLAPQVKSSPSTITFSGRTGMRLPGCSL
jgi:hypothetical protein